MLDVEINSNNLKKSYGDIFTYIINTDINLPEEGWKIHVSAYFDNYKEILKKVSDFLIKREISFKWINAEEEFYKSISKYADRKFSGKFITIYPENESVFYSILENLYDILKYYSGPFIVTDRRYKDCKVLYYRYGAFKESSKLKCIHSFYTQPEYVVDKLNENVENDSILLNERYEVNDCIYATNLGGVYTAVDKRTGYKVVLKEIRSFINEYESYINGEDYLKLRLKEKENLIKFSNSPYTPNYIDDFYYQDNYYLVVEYIEGFTLNEIFERYPLYLLNRGELNLNFNLIISQIFNNLLKCIKSFNEKNYLLYDISEKNFIVDEDYNVYFIDLEYLDEIKNIAKSKKMIKERFINRKILLNYTAKIDEYKLAILFLSAMTRLSVLLYDLYIIWLNFKEISYIYKIDKKLMKSILLLLKDYDNRFVKEYDNIIIKKIENNVSIKTYYIEDFEERKTKFIINSIDKYHNSKIFFDKLNIVFELCFFENKEMYKDVVYEMYGDILKFIQKKIIDMNTTKILLILLKYYEIFNDGKIEYLFEELFNKFKEKYFKNKCIYMDEKNKISPYIRHGNAGLILLMLKYNELKYRFSKKEIYDLINFDYSFANKIGFGFGISGLLYIQTKLYEVYLDEEILRNSFEKYNVIKSYLEDKKLINRLEKSENQFSDGLLGIDFSIKEFLDMIGGDVK